MDDSSGDAAPKLNYMRLTYMHQGIVCVQVIHRLCLVVVFIGQMKKRR